MPRFDLYRNPNPRATHGMYLDVQSDLVLTSTRWCLPLFVAPAAQPMMTRAQWLLGVEGQDWVVDTPNILAVPRILLRADCGHLESADQFRAESALDFMLRGY